MTNEAPETIWAYGNSVCDDWDCDEGDWTKQKSCSEDWPHDAADMLENGNGIGGQLSAKRVRAMIEKEQTDE